MTATAAGLISLPGSEPPDHGATAGEMVEPAQRDLRAAGVVHTQEQHDRGAVGAATFDFGKRLEPLAGEALGHQRQEADELGPVGELVVAGFQEQLDRLGGEEITELLVQRGGGELEGVALIDGQAVEVRHDGRSGWAGQ
jgi:hypothetical protein